MRLGSCAAALMVIAGLALPAAAQAPIEITIGIVPGPPSAPTYLAMEKGYFREAGISAKIELLDSGAKGIVLLASDKIQLLEGGLSAGYFNALAQNLPLMMALERGSSPAYQEILLRPDLKGKVKEVQDLKGRSIALVAPGSIVVYALGKVLESASMNLKDVDIKYMPFTQMGTALANGGLDAALSVSPFSDVALQKGLAVKWIDADKYVRPTPFALLAYVVNNDWTAQHREAVRRMFVALVRAGREYCQAYHHGPNRDEVLDIYMKYDNTVERALLDKIAWQSRDPNGRLNMASVLDIQHWFFKEGMIGQELPAERLVDTSYADLAAKELGPFELINKADPIPGCR